MLPVIISTLGKIGVSLLMSLLTEGFAKRVIVHSLDFVAKRTTNELDDKVAKDVRAAWQIED